MTSSEKSKVFVVGLDGATFDILDLFVEQGKMPNLGKVFSSGSKARLRSTIPPVTGPSWASFMTGKRPENHGIFDFVNAVPGQFARQTISYNSIKSQTLWSMLSDEDKKIGVMNVPITYPPAQVNGFVVSGMLTPSIEENFTYPPSLKDEIKENVGEYILDVWWQHYKEDTIEEFLRKMIDCTKTRIKTANFLLDNKDLDFFMTVFIGTDRIQHFLWDYLLKALSSDKLTEKDMRITKLITEYYQDVDKFIGQVLERMDENSNLIIMSDHGFGKLGGRFNINKWLDESGFLKFFPGKLKKHAFKANLGPEIKQIIKKLDTFNLRQKLRFGTKANAGRMKGYEFLDCVDWQNSKAYSVSITEQGIYLNVKGREPHGVVEPGEEYEQLRDAIIQKLKEIKDPETGNALVTSVYKKEEVYDGKYDEGCPDIIFFLKGGEYIAAVQPTVPLFEGSNLKTGTGTHRMDGVFIAMGPDIKKGAELEEFEIIDVAPTILHLLNIAVPEDMDGKVTANIFLENFLEQHPVQYRSNEQASVAQTQPQQDTYSMEEEDLLRERLQGLGYLD